MSRGSARRRAANERIAAAKQQPPSAPNYVIHSKTGGISIEVDQTYGQPLRDRIIGDVVAFHVMKR